MAKRKAIVRDKILTVTDETSAVILKLDITDAGDKKHFEFWLNGTPTKSFRFIAADGTSCSVYKELRYFHGWRKKKYPVWYAHKRLKPTGKLRRKYIGVARNVTYEKLRQAAFELCQLELSDTHYSDG